jgi:integrase
MMKSFACYNGRGGALEYAEALVGDLARGSQVTALTPEKAKDALAALERLEEFYRATGRRVSLLAVASEWSESATKLGDRTMSEAVQGYLSTVAVVSRKGIAEAVEEFIAAEDPRTKASEGQRAQLSPKYAYNRAIMLRRFAGAFPGHAVCDLAKEHLDAFIVGLAKWKSKSRNGKPVSSAKGRNHHRAAVRQFLQWAVRKDYLPATHRLDEADAMRPEHANNAEIEFYTPDELRALLEVAEGPMRAMVALAGLAGLRTAELLRLTWEDVWRVPGHIEVTAGKAKTRQRRLIEVVPALSAWLESFRNFQEGKLCDLHEVTWQQHFVDLCEKAGVTRKSNGLRHGFCSFHFAAHGNEHSTAHQAGNSPAMLHQNYKGLATRKEGEAWFTVAPAQAANVIPLAAVSQRQEQ